MQHKFAMNKALEQKLIGPMEESHTEEQSPQAVLREMLWVGRALQPRGQVAAPPRGDFRTINPQIFPKKSY